MAGGASSLVADKVFVIRRLPNRPEPIVIKVSLSRAKRDGNENVRLAEGDLVSVESTPTTMAVDTVGKFFRVALGLSGNLALFSEPNPHHVGEAMSERACGGPGRAQRTASWSKTAKKPGKLT